MDRPAATDTATARRCARRDARRPRGSLCATALAMAWLLAATGCEVATIGAPLAAATYQSNTTLEVIVDAYHAQVLAASVTALEDMDMVIESERADEQEGKLVGRTTWGESVVVETEQENGVNSVLSIRVGLLGDVGLSWDIYRSIKRNLYREGLIQLASHRPPHMR